MAWNKCSLIVCATAVLSACGGEPPVQLCAVSGPNFLQDPEFSEQQSPGRLTHWASSQHAGDKVYEQSVVDGSLHIDKNGNQVWYMVKQVLPAEELVGKKLAFTTDLKLAMRPPQQEHGFEVGGGLQISAYTKPLVYGRSKMLFNSTLNHQPRLGDTGWQPVQVVFEVPADSATLEVGFLHQADGSMMVRSPALQVVDEAAGPCPVTPVPTAGS